MDTQSVLRNIDANVKRGRSSSVILSLDQWETIKDIVYELSSPRLLRSIEEARKNYKKARPYKAIRAKLVK